MIIDGKDVSHEKDAVRSVIGVVFQEPTLDNKMTVLENLIMHCRFYAIPKSETTERIQFVLNLVDLLEWKKVMVSSLSGGMKRRLEIARSLLHYPKVLFLDEPTTGLDPQTRAHIWDYIVKLQKEKNITIFLTTHYMDEAEICSKVAIMDTGKIVAMDSPYRLKQQYTKDRANITTRDEPGLETLLNKAGFIYKKKTNLAGYYHSIHWLFHRTKIHILDHAICSNRRDDCRWTCIFRIRIVFGGSGQEFTDISNCHYGDYNAADISLRRIYPTFNAAKNIAICCLSQSYDLYNRIL